jgi:hypothetical protein
LAGWYLGVQYDTDDSELHTHSPPPPHTHIDGWRAEECGSENSGEASVSANVAAANPSEAFNGMGD